MFLWAFMYPWLKQSKKNKSHCWRTSLSKYLTTESWFKSLRDINRFQSRIFSYDPMLVWSKSPKKELLRTKSTNISMWFELSSTFHLGRTALTLILKNLKAFDGECGFGPQTLLQLSETLKKKREKLRWRSLGKMPSLEELRKQRSLDRCFCCSNEEMQGNNWQMKSWTFWRDLEREGLLIMNLKIQRQKEKLLLNQKLLKLLRNL
jgi:hypothetical protein